MPSSTRHRAKTLAHAAALGLVLGLLASAGYLLFQALSLDIEAICLEQKLGPDECALEHQIRTQLQRWQAMTAGSLALLALGLFVLLRRFTRKPD